MCQGVLFFDRSKMIPALTSNLRLIRESISALHTSILLLEDSVATLRRIQLRRQPASVNVGVEGPLFQGRPVKIKVTLGDRQTSHRAFIRVRLEALGRSKDDITVEGSLEGWAQEGQREFELKVEGMDGQKMLARVQAFAKGERFREQKVVLRFQ